MRLVDTGDWHAVRISTPSPGWRVDFDHSRPTLDGRVVFLTLTKPDPRFVYPQQVVEQLVTTDVPRSEPITVYGRTVAADGKNVTRTYTRVKGLDLQQESP